MHIYSFILTLYFLIAYIPKMALWYVGKRIIVVTNFHEEYFLTEEISFLIYKRHHRRAPWAYLWMTQWAVSTNAVPYACMDRKSSERYCSSVEINDLMGYCRISAIVCHKHMSFHPIVMKIQIVYSSAITCNFGWMCSTTIAFIRFKASIKTEIIP